MAITPAATQEYLRRRVDPSLTLERLKRVEMGLSRQTWIADLGDRKLVLRADQPGGASACPTPLELEYEIYRRLGGSGVPVARALWFEDDESVLGSRFYVREYVDGDTTVRGFDDPDSRFDDLRIDVSKEHARKMALVHTVDWRALGLDELLGAPLSPAQCAVATIDRLAGQITRVAIEPMPLLDLALSWLRAQAPTTSPAVTLCKGSNGAMQEIWRGVEIVGMSDWELASIGDPANDWARCQGYVVAVEGRWDERRLLDYYASLTGYEISQESMDFYRTVYSLEMLLVGLHSALPIVEGTLPDARLAYLATSTVHAGLDRLARQMGIA